MDELAPEQGQRNRIPTVQDNEHSLSLFEI